MTIQTLVHRRLSYFMIFNGIVERQPAFVAEYRVCARVKKGMTLRN